MSNTSRLDSAIRYFAGAAFLGALLLITAVILGLLHAIAQVGSVVIGGAGLLMLAMGLREVARGRRLRIQRLAAPEISDGQGGTSNSVGGDTLLTRYFAWGALFGVVAVLVGLTLGLASVIPIGGALALAFVGLVAAITGGVEFVRVRHLRSVRIRTADQLDDPGEKDRG